MASSVHTMTGMGRRSREQVVRSVQLTLSRLMRVSASRSTFARQAAAGGVTLRQPSYDLLRVMVELGPIRMGELARRAHMDVGMATREAQALVEEGLVDRTPDPHDRRVTLVALTEAGRAAVTSLMEVRARHLQEALSAWSKSDLELLDQLLTKFLEDTFRTPFPSE